MTSLKKLDFLDVGQNEKFGMCSLMVFGHTPPHPPPRIALACDSVIRPDNCVAFSLYTGL